MPLNPAKAFQTLTLLAGITAALLANGLAYADTITYSGTVGKYPILLEITEPADGPLLARYTYLSQGADIPLHQQPSMSDDIVLAEELPCTPEICVSPYDTPDIPEPPLGARWQIKGMVGDATLTGKWQDGDKPALALTLSRIGKRAYDRQDYDPYGSFTWDAYGQSLTAAASPYDYYKLQVPLQLGEIQQMDGNTYRNVTDPRTKFPFPRVVSLSDGSDPGPINATLAQQHGDTSYNALGCLSMAYLGGGWDGRSDGYSPLGDYDAEQISVLYLSPKVMSIVQSGSVYCGGASPYNHMNYSNIDVVTGQPLDLSRIFKGWVASKADQPVDLATARANPSGYDWRPDAALVAYVRATRVPDPFYDPDCEIDQNIPTNLDINFLEGGQVAFRIAHLQQGQLPCEADLFTVPIGDIRNFLTPEAADFFPSLNN